MTWVTLPSWGTAMTNEVDDWFAERQHPLTDAMQLARKLILDADSRVSESIKWKTPTFSYEGNIVSFNPSTKFVSLLFHRGSEIEGDFPHLLGDGRLVRRDALRGRQRRRGHSGRAPGCDPRLVQDPLSESGPVSALARGGVSYSATR